MRGLPWVGVCLVVCLLAFANSAQGAVTDDLFAYWNMDGDLADAVGVNHDGTMSSTSGDPATFAAGKFGQAIDLDSADEQYVVVGDISNEADFDFVGSSISISAWFTVESFDTNWQALIAKGEGTSWRIARRSGSNVMAYAGGTGDIPTDDTTGPDVTGGGWHHVVAITEEGVSTRLWVDGGLVATNDDPVPSITDHNDLQALIGSNPNQLGRSWNGMIDDVGIWTRPISENEIGYLWNGGAGNPVIPEPTSMTLAGLGLLALGLVRRRK